MALQYLGMFSGGIGQPSGQPALVTALNVYDYGTANPSSLYLPPSSLPYPIVGAISAPNPIFTDQNGNVEFWAIPGYYDLWLGAVKVKSISVGVDPSDVP